MPPADRPDQLAQGRLRRAAPVVGLAARTAIGRLGASLRTRLGNDAAMVEFHERNALRYAESLSNARGVLLKAGQLMSFVQPAGLVTAEHWSPYQDALASLRTAAEPMHPDLARAVVEAELGGPPEALFASFDPEPLAAASIGQVHGAVLHDGRRVAVKVQYPGVAGAIAADLANTELLATLLRLGQSTLPRMPQVDGRAIAAELGARVAEELDYVGERTNLELFADIYAGDPSIRIPGTHRQLSSPRVLTMDRVDGMGWDEALLAPQELRNRWEEAINRFFFRSIYRHGIFHADPHPGNYVFHGDGAVTILDFGCVKRFDDATLDGFIAITESTVTGDAERLAAAFRRHGFVGADAPSPDELLTFYRPTLEGLIAPQPFRMTTEFANRVLTILNPYGPEGHVSRRFGLPPNFVLATRIYVGLFSVLAGLEAEADWRAPYDDDLRHYHEHGPRRAAVL